MYLLIPFTSVSHNLHEPKILWPVAQCEYSLIHTAANPVNVLTHCMQVLCCFTLCIEAIIISLVLFLYIFVVFFLSVFWLYRADVSFSHSHRFLYKVALWLGTWIYGISFLLFFSLSLSRFIERVLNSCEYSSKGNNFFYTVACNSRLNPFTSIRLRKGQSFPKKQTRNDTNVATSILILLPPYLSSNCNFERSN